MRRAPRSAGYSGHPATGTQVQVSAGAIVAGLLGVIATKPTSFSGAEPEKIGPAATWIEPTLPS